MSALLGPRARCLDTACLHDTSPCGYFVIMSDGAESMIPSSATNACSACGHAWYSHLLESLPTLHPSPGQQRGTCIPETSPTALPVVRNLANCGGFYSTQNPSQWTYTSICVCERMFRTHSPFMPSGARANIPDRQVAPVSVGFNVGNPALSSFPGSAGVAQQAPCVAYQGLRTSSSANMPRTRTTALARAGGGPAGPSANPFAHASTPLPQNAPTTSIMTSASSSASLPSASSPSTPIDLCVVLIPHVDPAHASGREAYPERHFKWDGSQFASLVEELLQYKLVFKISLSPEGPVWREFHDGVLIHLRAHGLEIPDFASDSFTPTGPHNTCFRLITTSATGRRSSHRIYRAYDDLPPYHWTSKRLMEKPFTHVSFPHDGEMSKLAGVVLIVPRSINVRGTLPLVHPRRHEAWEDYDLQAARFALHPCLTPRIMSVIERAFLPRCRCTAECPEQDGLEDAEFPSRSPSPFDLRIGNCHALPSEGCNDESRMVLEHMSADTGINLHSATLSIAAGSCPTPVDPSASSDMPSVSSSATAAPVVSPEPLFLPESSTHDASLAGDHQDIKPSRPTTPSARPRPRPRVRKTARMSTGSRAPRGLLLAPPPIELAMSAPSRHDPSAAQLFTESPASLGPETSLASSSLQVLPSGLVALPDMPVPVLDIARSRPANSTTEPPAKEQRVAEPPASINEFRPVTEGVVHPLITKTGQDLRTWGSRVRSAVPYDLVNDRRPSLNAPSVQVAGDTLYFLVHWLFEHADDEDVSPDLREYRFTRALDDRFNSQVPVNSPSRVLCAMTSLLRLMKHCDSWNLTIGGAVGEGVTRNLLRQAIQVAVQVPDLWQTRGSYSTIQFLPYSQERERMLHLKTCGYLCLLHMVALQSGPEPISPFLLRTAIEPRECACAADVAFLRLLSPEDVKTLVPWISHDKSVSVPVDLTSNVSALLMAADIDPTWVSTSASRIFQTELHLVSHTLFGLKDMYQEPDFLAFRQGMTCVLTTPGNTLDITFLANARNYLAAMFHRRLEDVEVLLQHLEFRSTLDPHTVESEARYSDSEQVNDACWDIHYEHLLEEKFKRYLRGSGHPDHWFIRSMVSSDEFDAASQDLLLRARSFLQLMTGSDLVPSGNHWKIVIFFHHKGKRENFGSPGHPARLHVHACFAHGDLIVDEGMRNMLIEPTSDDGKEPLLFDSWLHAAVMDPSDFNSI